MLLKATQNDETINSLFIKSVSLFLLLFFSSLILLKYRFTVYIIRERYQGRLSCRYGERRVVRSCCKQNGNGGMLMRERSPLCLPSPCHSYPWPTHAFLTRHCHDFRTMASIYMSHLYTRIPRYYNSTLRALLYDLYRDRRILRVIKSWEWKSIPTIRGSRVPSRRLDCVVEFLSEKWKHRKCIIVRSLGNIVHLKDA